MRNKALSCILLCAALLVAGCGSTLPTQAERESYVQNNPSLDEPIRSAILAGNLVEGMSKEQVRFVMGGDPISKNTYASENGTFEQWRYGSSGALFFVYFQNGEVVSFGTHERFPY